MRARPGPTISPLWTALLAQVFGALIALGLFALIYRAGFQSPLLVALAQGGFAAFSSHKLGAPAWWLPIHLGFMPSVVVASGLDIPPGWYLAAFLVLLLVFWRIDRSRVPLFLSSQATAAALAGLLPAGPGKVLDLGCGNGALLKALAHQRPDCAFLGIEHAPLPWLWARLNCRGLPNCLIRYGDFWAEPLADFDLVYAFLSPAPMPNLWKKALAEMRPQALLVSNSFPVPDVPAAEILTVADRRATRLYRYRPAG
jgi:hypothetical protein